MKKERVQELLNIVKRNYREIAVDFDKTRKKEIWPEIRKISADIKDGESVLDVGCGNGRLLEALADKGISYLGVDNSAELINAAKQNYPAHNFLTADILRLDDLPAGGFDEVFCLAVLQHIPSRELQVEAMRQLGKKLNSGGRLVVSVWNLWRSPKHRPLLFKNCWHKILGKYELDYNDLLFSWKDSSGQEISQRYYHAFTKKELKKITRLAGLRLVRLEQDAHNFWLIASSK